MEKILKEIYEIVKKNNNGKVADYIPELGKVNPDLFGISVCTVDGQFYEIGDTHLDFCLQSTSKPYSYCIARELLGRDKVHSHVGYEPSGQAFNAFILNKQGLPHNPLINAGAIMIASLLGSDKEPAERFNLVKDYLNKMSGNIGKISFDNSVFLSERQHADRNVSLAYYMRENGAFGEHISPSKIQENLDLYFQCCSILINCKIGSAMVATLANGGTCPITGEDIFSSDTIRDCLTLMYGCGMYDFSGQFAFEIGLPAKSGVSGCIMVVIPNVMGICIWAPRLDDIGNSIKGIEVCRELSKRNNYHIFHNMVSNTNNIDVDEDVLLQKVITACAKGNINFLRIVQDKIDFNKGDYDNRTPIHLAVSEGQFEVVNFLIEQDINKNVKDRWGNTPFSEIKNKEGENYDKIRELLEG